MKDPFSRVFAIGTERRVAAVAGFAALLLHGTATASAVSVTLDMFHWAEDLRGKIAELLLDQQYNVEEIKPLPPPEEELPKEELKPEKPPELKKDDTPPPPPAAAEAAKIIAQDPNPEEPLDLTNAMVTGNANAYAGGETRANGTSEKAVRNVATSPTGVPGGTGSVNAPAKDLSRPPSRNGSQNWDCPWPQEAESDQIDEAVVTILVTIEANGKPSKIVVVEGGEHGFGREARACALRESYNAGLDQNGTPVAAQKSLRIHFER